MYYKFKLTIPEIFFDIFQLFIRVNIFMVFYYAGVTLRTFSISFLSSNIIRASRYSLLNEKDIRCEILAISDCFDYMIGII